MSENWLRFWMSRITIDAGSKIVRNRRFFFCATFSYPATSRPKIAMKMHALLLATVTAIFAVPAFSDHDQTTLPFGLGQKEGHWTERSKDGNTLEGHYVNGKRHGHWVFRLANGTVSEGTMVNNKKTWPVG